METESESSVNVSGGDTAGDNETSEAVTNIDPEPDIEVPWKLCTNQHLTTTVKHARAPVGRKRRIT